MRGTFETITQDILNDYFRYEESTGKLYWKWWDRKYFKTGGSHFAFGGKYAGKEVGYLGANHHRHVRVEGKLMPVHRIIWKMHHGVWPDFVTRKDHNMKNTRLENLVEGPIEDIGRNRPKQRNNVSGMTGVSWNKYLGNWMAQIYVNKRLRHLGNFKYFVQAAQARAQANEKYGVLPTHGVSRAEAESLLKSRKAS